MDYRVCEYVDGNGNRSFAIQKRFLWFFWKRLHGRFSSFPTLKRAQAEANFYQTIDNLDKQTRVRCLRGPKP